MPQAGRIFTVDASFLGAWSLKALFFFFLSLGGFPSVDPKPLQRIPWINIP